MGVDGRSYSNMSKGAPLPRVAPLLRVLAIEEKALGNSADAASASPN
jgi:hypothetical protein